MMSAIGRTSVGRGILIVEDFLSFFWLLFCWTVAVCHSICDFHFIWRTEWGCECMYVRSDMYVCVSVHVKKKQCDWRTGWSEAGLERQSWRGSGRPSRNGRVIGWDEKWESLTFCYLQGWLIAREPIQLPHPCATPSPIKIFNYREGGWEGWR